MNVPPGPGEIGYSPKSTVSITRVSELQAENEALRKELFETKLTLEQILEEFIGTNDKVKLGASFHSLHISS